MEGSLGYETGNVGCFPGGHSIPFLSGQNTGPDCPRKGAPNKVTLVPKLNGKILLASQVRIFQARGRKCSKAPRPDWISGADESHF